MKMINNISLFDGNWDRKDEGIYTYTIFLFHAVMMKGNQRDSKIARDGNIGRMRREIFHYFTSPTECLYIL